MAKKFFYNKVYNTKKNIINAIIIGGCAIGVIICFIVVSNFNGEDFSQKSGNVSIKNEVTIEINEEFTKEIFFSKIENVNLDDITINYALDFDASKVGSYDATIIIDDKNYTSTINVIDTTKPELVLKDHKIEKNKSYKAMDFVTSCTDNSNKECKISFYNDGIDQDGTNMNYSSYTEEGIYPIKIVAEDDSGNKTIKEVTLTIGSPNTQSGNNDGGNNETTPTTCKYGNNYYDTNTYILTADVTTNKCAVSLDLYNDENITTEINKITENETKRIQKDIEKLNLTGKFSLNRKIAAVINNTANGIVGFQLQMTVILSEGDESNVIADYKVDSNGKRIFINNPYNLSN